MTQPKTLIQKIFEHKMGRDIAVGEILEVPVDLAWGSEMTLKYAIDILRDHGLLDEEYDAQIRSQAKNIMFPFDHLIPATDARAASLMVDLREFAHEYDIRIFEVGYDGGIQHRLFEERGFLFPGQVGVGADSHSCTYGALSVAGTGIGSTDLAAIVLSGTIWLQVPSSISVHLHGKPKKHVSGKDIVLTLLGFQGVDGATYQSLEFTGDGLQFLDMASRFTISNMAIEGGAKFGLFPIDRITLDYLSNVVARNFPNEIRFDPRKIGYFCQFKGDDDAAYSRKITIGLDRIEPMIALPYLPENSIGIYQLNYLLTHQEHFQKDQILTERIKWIVNKTASGGEIPIQQVFIGTCTNGRIEDLRVAAEILRSRKVAKGVRTIIIPASQQVYRQALTEGLMEIFLEAGCYVESSSCGPCIGMKSGVLGKGETAIFTSNRNFYGRTGDTRSLVLLASPAVAAASAIEGKLTSPGRLEEYYSSEEELVESLHRVSQARKRSLADAEAMLYQANIKKGDHKSAAKCSTAWCFGDDVNTDLIVPSRYCNITDPAEYKRYLLLDAENVTFLEHYKSKNYRLESEALVAGKNFGCGSSRESAPVGIKTAGIQFVVAHSFARLFYRNAINIGLPIFEIGNAVYNIKQGDQLVANFETGEILNTSQGESYQGKPIGEFQKKVYQAGGLIPYLKNAAKETIHVPL